MADTSVQQPTASSSPIVIAVAWIIVAIPAGWGVGQTFMKSLALFQQPTAAPASPASVIAK
jgi:hypothetical protein